jgi:hypothetical protein
MKIHASRNPDFAPVTLVLTIQSPQELEMLYAMTALDQDIPTRVERETCAPSSYGVCATFLSDLRTALCGFR